MSQPKYLEQWEIPSSSDPDKSYKVTQYESGVWKCSCPHWIFRLQKTGEDCQHISLAKDGLIQSKSHLKIVLAVVKHVTLKENDEVYVPLIPLGDTAFQATVIYDLVKVGVPFRELKERYRLSGSWTWENIKGYVEAFGRKTIRVWVQVGETQYPEYIWIPVEKE